MLGIDVAAFVVGEVHDRIEAPRLLRELAHVDEPHLLRNRSVQLRAAQFALVAFLADVVATADLHRRAPAIAACRGIDDAIGAASDFAAKSPVPAVNAGPPRLAGSTSGGTIFDIICAKRQSNEEGRRAPVSY